MFGHSFLQPLWERSIGFLAHFSGKREKTQRLAGLFWHNPQVEECISQAFAGWSWPILWVGEYKPRGPRRLSPAHYWPLSPHFSKVSWFVGLLETFFCLVCFDFVCFGLGFVFEAVSLCSSGSSPVPSPPASPSPVLALQTCVWSLALIKGLSRGGFEWPSQPSSLCPKLIILLVNHMCSLRRLCDRVVTFNLKVGTWGSEWSLLLHFSVTIC